MRASPFGYLRLRRDHRSDQHARRFEAEVRRLKPQERSQQQAAPDQHDERDRDLVRRRECACARCPCRSPAPACAVLESLPKRMRETPEATASGRTGRRSEGDRGGERQHVPIDLGPLGSRADWTAAWPRARRRPRFRRAARARRRSTASSRLSVSSCRTTRARRAPSAAARRSPAGGRTPRASSRLATLAQAMRSTKPTAASSTSSDLRMSPTICSWSGTTANVTP